MHTTLGFPDLLRLIDERSAAFRAAVAAAPDLDAPVPTCPGWTLFDLARHIGEGRRAWAATVAAGPAAAKSAPVGAPPAPRDREALSDWLAASTRELLDALREAGPDANCWVWWGVSQSPPTTGAVARHQLQEIAVHTYDAQLTAGAPRPLPDEVAVDGVEDFLFTCCATTHAWPHDPAVVEYHATEGRSWRLWLSADGARAARLPEPGNAGGATAGGAAAGEVVDASARASAHELVLALYGRAPMDSLDLVGDRRVFDGLVAWEPGA
ncbi:maleylpyruvate isomerase N-terminal domain-containing protein [Saccharothrix sp. Mg75]|uniref:maleylpyruvate isomerase N-terminal domain-containing protein n=1 Tax=Saccharothrix sp. Mg75 TaxID=3445357 RepID=UPI003EE87901